MVFLTDFSSGSEKWFQLFVHCTPPLLPAAVLLPPEVPDLDTTELNTSPPVIAVVPGHHLHQPGQLLPGLHHQVAHFLGTQPGVVDLLELAAVVLEPLEDWLWVVTVREGMFGRHGR